MTTEKDSKAGRGKTDEYSPSRLNSGGSLPAEKPIIDYAFEKALAEKDNEIRGLEAMIADLEIRVMELEKEIDRLEHMIG